MSCQRHTSRRLVLLLGATGAVGLWAPIARAEEPLAVVVGRQIGLEEVSLATLERVFLNKPTNDGRGHRFIPLNHPPSLRTRARFDRAVLRMEPEEVERYWIDQKLRGRRPPRTVRDPALLPDVLPKVDGAISYVPLGSVTSALVALRIDGKKPGDDGYPIV